MKFELLGIFLSLTLLVSGFGLGASQFGDYDDK
jgi:hypothetical protein